MARVTIEDCVKRIPSRFALVVLAAQRAKDINAGAAPQIDRQNHKDAVVALLEIEQDKVSPALLREEVIARYQSSKVNSAADHPEDDSDQEEIRMEMTKMSYDNSDISALSQDLDEDGGEEDIAEDESDDEIEGQ